MEFKRFKRKGLIFNNNSIGLGLAVRIKLKDSLWISLPALFYMTLNAYIFLEAINYQQFF